MHIMRVADRLVALKGTFVESPTTRKVTQVGMVNILWFNGMEIQGFSSAKSLAPFRGTEPAV